MEIQYSSNKGFWAMRPSFDMLLSFEYEVVQEADDKMQARSSERRFVWAMRPSFDMLLSFEYEVVQEADDKCRRAQR